MDRTTIFARRAACAVGLAATAALLALGDRWLQHYLFVWLAVGAAAWFVENRTR